MARPGWWKTVVDGMVVRQRADPRVLPGAVMAAETRADGQLVASLGEGWSDDSICVIGSMTKAFMATALLLALEEHDALDLEAPVAGFPGMAALADDPRGRRLRVRHLLQHTAGMPMLLPHDQAPATACHDPAGPPRRLAGDERSLGATAPFVGSPGYTNGWCPSMACAGPPAPPPWTRSASMSCAPIRSSTSRASR